MSGWLWNQWKVVWLHLWDSGRNHKRRHEFKFKRAKWNTDFSLCNTGHRHHKRVSPIAVSRHTYSRLCKLFLTLSLTHCLAVGNCSRSHDSVSLLGSICCKIAHFPTWHLMSEISFQACTLATWKQAAHNKWREDVSSVILFWGAKWLMVTGVLQVPEFENLRWRMLEGCRVSLGLMQGRML